MCFFEHCEAHLKCVWYPLSSSECFLNDCDAAEKYGIGISDFTVHNRLVSLWKPGGFLCHTQIPLDTEVQHTIFRHQPRVTRYARDQGHLQCVPIGNSRYARPQIYLFSGEPIYARNTQSLRRACSGHKPRGQ